MKVPVLGGTVGLGPGLIAAGASGSLWPFRLAQGLLMGRPGTSAKFAPRQTLLCVAGVTC